jgi:cAMP-dependent protein kinase regulator
MKPEKAVREAERALEQDPANLALRLRLASALRAANRHFDALDVYRSVAVAYQKEGRLLQALAVCRSILELAPDDLETNVLLQELEAARTGGSPGEEPTRHDDGHRLPLAPQPEVAVGPDDFEDDEPVTPPPIDFAQTVRGLGREPPAVLARIVTGAAQAELAARLMTHRFAPGEVIVREGDRGDSCFVIASGTVRVTKGDVEVNRMGPGSFFGELALLADGRRHATVHAVEACELHEIPRLVLDALSARHPEVRPALERLYRERLVATLVGHAPFFQPLPADQRLALMTRFTAAHVEAGAVVIREGERGGGLYLVLLGAVDVTRRGPGGAPVKLATLGEGTYFGEISLLRGTVASATVTAARPTQLALLPRDEFYAAVASYPLLWDELRREARRRELASQDILAGDTDAV